MTRSNRASRSSRRTLLRMACEAEPWSTSNGSTQARRSTQAGPVYNDTVVRQFALAAVVWGVVGMLVGVIIAAQLTWPRTQLRHPLAQLRPAAAAAHQCGDLRLRRLRAVRHQLLRRAAHLPGAAVLAASWPRSRSGAGRLVIVAAAITLPLGYHAGQGIRRARMADRPPDRRRLGRLRDRLLRHHRHPQGAPHLCRQLVLRRLHPRPSRCCTSSTARRCRSA